MNQAELIDWLVHHLDCTDCPLYVQCMADRPRTCREYISKMLQACDNVTNQAVKNLVTQIRAKHTAMIRETDGTRRRTLLDELTAMKRRLKDVKEYIDG